MADDDTTPPLSQDEIKHLRILLKQDDRVSWLWATIRLWAVWIAAVLGGATLLYGALRDAVRALGGPPH